MPNYRQRAFSVQLTTKTLPWFVYGQGEWSGQGHEPRVIDRFANKRRANRLAKFLNKLYEEEGRLLPEDSVG